MSNRELSDDEVDEALETAILGYEIGDRIAAWRNRDMRLAYRAGWEDARNG